MSSNKSTETERRFTFKSFKERVDSLRIEPHRKLTTRAHDYVETSHFLATLDHWREVNLSADFTEFVREVEPLCQTLPQLLHHQKSIYEYLSTHISKNDANSIQPLLELVSQFIHDLGPDFMPFYLDFLNLIMDIVLSTNPNELQNQKNASNILEWCFNSLAFAFKYLSRTLVSDLRPTFNKLLPVFQLTKKTYVSRFCAEAFSFLIKKSSKEGLESIIQLSLVEEGTLLRENQSYRQTLVTLYSEAMKNTNESFHSKAIQIFSVLLEISLYRESSTQYCISTLCDILSSVSKHGSVSSCDKFYSIILDHLVESIEKTASVSHLRNVTTILLTMCFTESGRKIQDWPKVLKVIGQVMNKSITSNFPQTPETSFLFRYLADLFAIVIRNCEFLHLSKWYPKFSSFLTKLPDCRYYLAFYEIATSIAREKMLHFKSVNSLQSFVNNMEEDQLIYLSLFFIRLRDTSRSDLAHITLPQSITQSVISSLKPNEQPIDCGELYWKMNLLLFAPGDVSHCQLQIVSRVMEEVAKIEVKSQLQNDTLGLMVNFLARLSDYEPEELTRIYNTVRSAMDDCKSSEEFLLGAKQFFATQSKSLHGLIKNDGEFFSGILSENFSSCSLSIRIATAALLSEAAILADENSPFVVSQVNIIDNIPRAVTHANDIKMRIRLMAESYSSSGHHDRRDRLQFCNYLVGLLSDNFQPCWNAVYDVLPQVSSTDCSEELWDVLYEFSKLDYEAIASKVPETDDMAIDSEDVEDSFEMLDERLSSHLVLAKETFSSNTSQAQKSISNLAWSRGSLKIYKPLMRSRVLKAIQTVPALAEKHGAKLLSFIFEVCEELDQPQVYGKWSSKEKLELITCCSKFKRIRRIEGSEKLFGILSQNLSSKNTAVQKQSLDIIFVWNISGINKYKDNLKNLLDDKLFRDELQSLISKSSESKIEDADRTDVIPLILRLLYGRAKGASNNNNKHGRKFAIANILPNFPHTYITQFLDIISENIKFDNSVNFGETFEVSEQELRTMTGYLNMLHEIFNGLGFKFSESLSHTTKPLLHSLIAAQAVLDQNIDEQRSRIARTVRQLGFKCLVQLFKITSNSEHWASFRSIIYEKIVKPRLANFAQENAQQPSSLMNIILSWADSPALAPFLYLDNFSPVSSIMNLLGNPHTKDIVRSAILDFCIVAFTRKAIQDEDFFTVLAIIVDGLLEILPQVIMSSEDREINSRAATLLLLVIEGGFVQDQQVRSKLVLACASALDKPAAQIGLNDKTSLILSMTSVVADLDCPFADIEPLYDTCSKMLRVFKDRSVRNSLVNIFSVIGSRYSDFNETGELIVGLNSYAERGIAEPDFEKRLKAFRRINEEIFEKLSSKQWEPILNSCLFFINDPNELVLRTNGALTVTRFVDAFSAKSPELAADYVAVFRSVVIPLLKKGFKKDSELIREGYVQIFSHAVRNHKYLPEFESMSVLISDDPEEDFFKNFTHIQMTARQKAVRMLSDQKGAISPDCLYRYLLPLTEIYLTCDDEKYRNLLDDCHDTWGALVQCLKWDNFKQVFKRQISAISQSSENQLRDRVHLSVRISQGLLASVKAHQSGHFEVSFKDLPSDNEALDKSIIQEFFDPMMKVIKLRNDDTVINRTPLVEAAINCLLSVSQNLAEAFISGTLTSTCQALRSRNQDIRDAVRKTLCRVSRTLDAKFFRFIVKELKSALSRGAQIHVLSYTLHSVLTSVKEIFKSGDLDESVSLVVDIIMEDIFGAAGQEKDAEGYVSKMKEVKSKKSFESAEILTSNISLPAFQSIVAPIRELGKENLPLKSLRKLDELLRMYAQGLQLNPASSSKDILYLCYELHKNSTAVEAKERKKTSDREDHFLVANVKPSRLNVDKMQSSNILQRMSFDLLRVALTKHSHLLSVGNIVGFLPLLEQSLRSEDEALLISSLKVLNIVVKLSFDSSKDNFFEASASRAFLIIQNSPSTSSEICQICLKYLATVIRSRGSVTIADSAISYLIVRVLPDLEEPDKQGLAFNFLKALLSQHIMLPEVYEVMDKVSNIMIVNHNKEIRSISRGLFYTFLMEYEQSYSKLEKYFKFLVNNLQYPTPEGRQSVMELMHSFVKKASSSLLKQLSTSFFVGLSKVAVSDESSKCREMANALISELLKKLERAELDTISNLILSWLQQNQNALLRRCGLSVYKIHVSVFGYRSSEKFNRTALAIIENTLKDSKKESEQSAGWENIYSALSVLSTVGSDLQEEVFTSEFERLWIGSIDTLLYPHSWVRLMSCRLAGVLLSNLDKIKFKLEPRLLQTIAYRLLRQLSAPSLSTDLGTQIVKNLVMIVKLWEKDGTLFIPSDHNEDEEMESSEQKYTLAVDFVIAKVCFVMRQDKNTVAQSSAIQLGALIAQLLSVERLDIMAEQLILGLYNIIEEDSLYSDTSDVRDLARECLKIIEERLGTTRHAEIFSNVKRQVNFRRQERKAKRTQMAINAPDLHARRKLKKHERFREKRSRDGENGFYKPKRRRV